MSTAATVAGIVASVLGRAAVADADDLYDLGVTSLSAIQVVARIRDALGVDLDFLAPLEAGTVGALARLVTEQVEGATAPDRIVPVPPDQQRLSAFQERLWHESMANEQLAFHAARAYRLTGPVDVGTLRRACAEVVRRQQNLRTSFPARDGSPYLLVRDRADPAFEAITAPPDAVDRLAAERVGRAFDIATGPLYRFALISSSLTSHVFVMCLHELVGDGWSLDVIARELRALYPQVQVAGEPGPLPDLDVQYADYAAWERASVTPEARAGMLDFWRRELAGAPLTLAFPVEGGGVPRPTPRRTASISVELSRELSTSIREFCATAAATPFIAFLAVYAALLHRYTGATDLVVYSPVANRYRVETEPLVGLFAVGNLPLRVDLRDDPSFAGLVDQIRDTVKRLFAYANTPLELILEAMSEDLPNGVTRQLHPRLRYRLPDEPLDLAGVRGEPYQPWQVDEHFAFWVDERPDRGYLLTATFERDSFGVDLVNRYLRQTVRLVEQALSAPDRPLPALDVLTDAEREPLRGPTVTAGPERLADLVAAQTERTPDAVAVHAASGDTTYAELLAAAVAAPVPPLDAPPSAGLLAALLAAPELPAERAIGNSARWVQARYRLCPGDRVVHVPGHGGAWSPAPWAALIAGATVVVPDGVIADLPCWLAEHGVTVASVPVARVDEVLAGTVPTLRQLIVWGPWPPGGELPVPGGLPVTAHLLLDELGGVVACAAPRDGVLTATYAPVANVALAVVSPDGRPVPPGGCGLLAVRADGRTARTNHLGVLRDDDTVALLGRKRDEVMLHGYRLTEVVVCLELVLREHPAVAAAAVAVAGRGAAAGLVAYVVAAGPDVDAAVLDDWLREQVGPVRPARYVQVRDLPLLADGTVDRATLVTSPRTVKKFANHH